MVIFKIKNDKLEKVKEKGIILEKDIQRLTELNLSEVFKLEYVSSQFYLQNLRIDTLCFDLEYNEKNKSKTLSRESINWSESRVIFISPFFTFHQKEAINFKNLPIELWEIKYYSDDLVEYQNIEPIESSEKIETLTENKFIKEVIKEVKNYDLEHHLKKGSEKTRKLFFTLKEKILELGGNQ